MGEVARIWYLYYDAETVHTTRLVPQHHDSFVLAHSLAIYVEV
jgi:hypothetical protein